MQNNKNMDSNKSGILIIVLLSIAAILVLLFPKIDGFFSSFSVPKMENNQDKNEENLSNERIEINEDVLETIHYPIMRTSIYDANTYYSLDTFTTNNLSNNDILLTAFLDMYEGNMTSYEGVGYCTNISKQFNKDYLILRIKNIIGNKVNYTLESFYVPEDSNTSYVGTWNYDNYNQRFTYVGLCQSKNTNVRYYNLEELIEVKYENKDILAYYYVGFAKVENDTYIIYKDANMTTEITTGTFTNLEELNNIYKNIDKNNKRIYKYTFKNNLCTYNEYCLYEGKWVNEF